MKNEFDFIEYLKRTLSKGRLKTGIGDDAAVFAAGRGDLVWTTDAVVDGVDFHLKKLSAEAVGRKTLAINLSDVAAMGARPESFTLSLGIPAGMPETWLKRFYRGMMELAAKYHVTCAGGDVSRSRVFFASVSMLGRTAAGHAVLRSGARSGDWIGVTGSLGGSIAEHHHAFEPRIREGMALARKRIRSMMDISDGLVQDLRHLLRASHAAARLNLEAVPLSREALKLAKGDRGKALNHALTDGEDFELLFTVSPRTRLELEMSWARRFPRTPLAWIGRIEKGKPGGIAWFRNGRKIAFRLDKEGYGHF